MKDLQEQIKANGKLISGEFKRLQEELQCKLAASENLLSTKYADMDDALVSQMRVFQGDKDASNQQGAAIDSRFKELETYIYGDAQKI